MSDISACNGYNPRIWRSPLSSGSAILLASGTAYFAFIGYIRGSPTVKFVEFSATAIGAGSQVAEVGLFSSPSAPNKAAQSLTKIVSVGVLDALTSLGVKRNTNAFNQVIASGTYLWAGIRTAMVTTQPTLRALNDDMGQGNVLSTASAGALTGAGPWTGAIIAGTVFQPAPDLRVTLD